MENSRCVIIAANEINYQCLHNEIDLCNKETNYITI